MESGDSFSPFFPVQSQRINGVSRADIVNALFEHGLASQSNAFSNCHSVVTLFECCDCGFKHFIPYRCGLRICPDCGRFRHRSFVSRLNEHVKRLADSAPDGYRLRLFTLTSPKVSELDKSIYAKMQEWFSWFRRHKLIKDKLNGGVGGGIYNIETKYSQAGDVYFRKRSFTEVYEYKESGFHVHIHGVILSKYIDQRKGEFSRAWYEASGGVARIADIRAVDSTYAAIYEATKYIFKAPRLGPAENYAIYLKSIKGKRLHNRFGSFRKFDLKKKKVKMYCAVCNSEDMIRVQSMDRYDALIEYESQKIPGRSLLSVYDDKPVLPVFREA